MTQAKSNSTKSLGNIAQAYQGFIDEPVPSVLFDVIESGASKKWLNIATVALAFAAGIALVLLINRFAAQKTEVELFSLPAEALALSAPSSLATDFAHPVQVNADDISHLNDWLSYRVGKNTPLKVLTNVGFSIIGANQIPDGMASSSMVVYENNDQERMSLFTRYGANSKETNEPAKAQSSGVNALQWQQDGAHHVLVSSVSHQVLKDVYRQLQR